MEVEPLKVYVVLYQENDFSVGVSAIFRDQKDAEEYLKIAESQQDPRYQFTIDTGEVR